MDRIYQDEEGLTHRQFAIRRDGKGRFASGGGGSGKAATTKAGSKASGGGAIAGDNETPRQAKGRKEADKVKNGDTATVHSAYGDDTGTIEHGKGFVTVHTKVGTRPKIEHGEIRSVTLGSPGKPTGGIDPFDRIQPQTNRPFAV